MNRVEYAEQARQLLARVRITRQTLAKEAGISPATLDTVLAPASAERSGALPRYLRALALAVESKSRELSEVAKQLSELAEQGEVLDDS